MQDRTGHFVIKAFQSLFGGALARAQLEDKISKKEREWIVTLEEVKRIFSEYIKQEEALVAIAKGFIKEYRQGTEPEKIDAAKCSASLLAKYRKDVLPLKKELLKKIGKL